MRLLVACILVLALFPAASALDLELYVEGGPLPPGGERVVPLLVRDVCMDAATSSQDGTLRYSIRALDLPAGVTVTGTELALPLQSCAGRASLSLAGNVTFRADPGLPGLKALAFKLVAERSGGTLGQPGNDTASYPFFVAFRPGIEVALPERPARVPAGTPSLAQVTVTNTGNALSVVNVTLSEGGQARVTQARAILLAPGESKPLPFEVEADAGMFSSIALEAMVGLKVTDALGLGAGMEQSVAVPLEVYGAARMESPGVGPVLALGLLAAAFVAVRRRGA